MADITYIVFPAHPRKKLKMEIHGDKDTYGKALKLLNARRSNYFDGWTMDVDQEDKLKSLITQLGGDPDKQRIVDDGKLKTITSAQEPVTNFQKKDVEEQKRLDDEKREEDQKRLDEE